nr:hypothetical protein GCM10025732_49390 [Glycomyces mayteni]
MADIRDVVEDGAYLIGLVRSLVEYSGFDPNDFVLAGSARLLHDRVIDGISDIDIVARGASLDLAFDLTFQDHHGGIELGEQTGDKIARLFGGKVNVSARWLRGLGSADELIQRADVFDGLRYLSTRCGRLQAKARPGEGQGGPRCDRAAFLGTRQGVVPCDAVNQH